MSSPGCPGLSRAGQGREMGLKGSAACFPRGGRGGHGGRETPFPAWRVVLFLFIHPAPAPPVCPFRSPGPRPPRGLLKAARGAGGHSSRAAPWPRSPHACVCWPRGHRGRSLWRPILVWIPPNSGPARRTRPGGGSSVRRRAGRRMKTERERRRIPARSAGQQRHLEGERGPACGWGQGSRLWPVRVVPATLPLQGFCSVLLRPL